MKSLQNARLKRANGRRVEPGQALSIVNPKLAKLLQQALDAMSGGDLVLALKRFGECAEIDPTNKAVLYFGSDAAQRGYFRLRYADPLPVGAKVDEWRHAALTLTMACHWADDHDPVAIHNIGRFLHDDGQDAEAVEWYQKALTLNRAQVESWGNLGTCLYTLGDVQGAELCWSKCVAFEATNPSGLLAQAYIWLRRGDYLRGWKALNARWDDQTFQASYGRPDLGGKMWTGQPLKKGDTLYLHGEQGLGDHVQFARYIPELIARGFKIAGLETRGPLKRWMEACLPDVLVFDRDSDKAPNFTHHVPLMSLPGLLGMEDVPPALAPFTWRDRRRESRVNMDGGVTRLAQPTDDKPILPLVALEVMPLDESDAATLGAGFSGDERSALDGPADGSVGEIGIPVPLVVLPSLPAGNLGIAGAERPASGVPAVAAPATEVQGLAERGSELAVEFPRSALGATLGGVGVDAVVGGFHGSQVPVVPVVPCNILPQSAKRVGLIFKGTTGNPIDVQRSLPDEMLAQLADIPGVTWVPLQYDPSGVADLTARAWLGKNVEPAPKYQDVLALGEIMAGLDMVVAVDTLGAHVAGSLGVPTLLLHRFQREWRWQQHTESCNWYPSVANLTCPAPNDWTSVLGLVRQRLTATG